LTSPRSPCVQVTTIVVWPCSAAKRSRPPVLLASSSGCACTTIRVWVFLVIDFSCAGPAPSPKCTLARTRHASNGGACVADGGRSHGGAQRLVAAHQARASTGDTLEPTILASWSTLPCCEARGVMRETWPTSASMTGRGGRRGLPGQELQRMHGGGPTRRMIENTAAGHHHRDEAQGAAVPGGRGAALPGAAGDGQSPPHGASAAGGLATS
jgi:hypothetical protein